jgi:hypothetical protein
MRHKDLFYRGSILANLLPVEVVTKDRVSFNPFPLSNGHLDRVSFSSQSNGTQSPRKDHHTIGVSCLGYNWVCHKKNEKEKKQSKRKNSNEHKYHSLTSHYWLDLFLGLGRRFDLFGVSRIECYSSCNVLKMENLDAIECGVVVVFIALTTKIWL